MKFVTIAILLASTFCSAAELKIGFSDKEKIEYEFITLELDISNISLSGSTDNIEIINFTSRGNGTLFGLNMETEKLEIIRVLHDEKEIAEAQCSSRELSESHGNNLIFPEFLKTDPVHSKFGLENRPDIRNIADMGNGHVVYITQTKDKDKKACVCIVNSKGITYSTLIASTMASIHIYKDGRIAMIHNIDDKSLLTIGLPKIMEKKRCLTQ